MSDHSIVGASKQLLQGSLCKTITNCKNDHKNLSNWHVDNVNFQNESASDIDDARTIMLSLERETYVRMGCPVISYC